MPFAHEVAAELRKLADSIDRSPDTKVVRASVYFSCHSKAEFLDIAKILPRPLAKRTDEKGNSWDQVYLDHKTHAINITASVDKSLTCELVTPAKPAVYRCAPILSLEEDASLIS
jgi:hypothetical protein